LTAVVVQAAAVSEMIAITRTADLRTMLMLTRSRDKVGSRTGKRVSPADEPSWFR
jgi:hypothetical protein